ncbi:hypothetical protein BDF21DRAFT_333554 [Thamnidium elegans]|nr:hypothetical protein BDF21DRAFT_333554 [Thamnidium elegans]
MGSNYSSLKESFTCSKHVPKHLQPTKQKKSKPKVDNRSTSDINIVTPKIIIHGEDDDQFAEETVMVGSGPRGAFRWFKGRRYLNYAKDGGLLDNSLLPNDQLELDRMRVLSYIMRWAFKGHVIAPVEEQLKSGIQVLNVGYFFNSNKKKSIRFLFKFLILLF